MNGSFQQIWLSILFHNSCLHEVNSSRALFRMKLFEMPHSCQTTCTTRSCSYLNRLGTLMPRSRRCDALTRPHVVRVTCNDEQIEWHEKDEIRWRNACCLHSNSPKRFTIASNSQQNVPAAVLLTTVLTRSVDPPPVVGYFLHKNRVT